VNQQRILTILGVVALVGIIGGVAALAAGGGDDTKVSASGSTTSSSAVAASVPTTTVTTTAVPPTSGQTSVTVGIICSSPDEASAALVDGWKAGDRAGAERCAAADAVNVMFQTNGAGAQYVSQGCDLSDPGVPICSWTYPGGSTAMTVEGTEAAGWKVTKVVFTAD
jgi:hypothetical protein